MDQLGTELMQMKTTLSGDPVRARLNESNSPSISGRASYAANTWQTTQSASQTQRPNFEQATSDFAIWSDEFEKLLKDDLKGLEADLLEAGAPGWR